MDKSEENIPTEELANLEKTYNAATAGTASPDLMCCSEEAYDDILKSIGSTREEFEKKVDVAYEDGLVFLAKKYFVQPGEE